MNTTSRLIAALVGATLTLGLAGPAMADTVIVPPPPPTLITVTDPGPRPATVVKVETICVGGYKEQRTIKTLWELDLQAPNVLVWSPVYKVGDFHPVAGKCGKRLAKAQARRAFLADHPNGSFARWSRTH